ncbi:MAG TPA: phage head closure protein [Ohtaekwangia sp.]|nr:phage head closure protein [Ohtaekwangia sp.]
MLQHKYQVGRFDRKIQIIRKGVTINEFNGETEGPWEVYKEPWSYEPPSFASKGSEVILADKNTAVRKMTRIIRYDNTIDEEMRVVYEDKVYEIISVREPEGTRRSFTELELEFLEGEEFTEAEGAFTSGFSSGFNT